MCIRDSFVPESGRDWLWLSPQAEFAPGKAVRGGIPLCLPWFGVNRRRPELPKHGWLRQRDWQLQAASCDAEGVVTLQLATASLPSELPDFPWVYEVEVEYRLGRKIELELRVRNCSDSYFRNRTRPCLQHQINRCTAPCVGLVSEADYARQVKMAADFLDGRSREVVEQLSADMEAASVALEFEKAAILRDQLAAIQSVQQKQYAETGQGDLDVVAIETRHGLAVIEVLMIRDGRILGHRTFRPDTRGEEDRSEILEAFLSQYYLGDREDPVKPQEILLSMETVSYTHLTLPTSDLV